MADSDNMDGQVFVLNGIQDAPVTLADAVLFLPGQFLAAVSTWILRQARYPIHDPSQVRSRDVFEVLPDGFLEVPGDRAWRPQGDSPQANNESKGLSLNKRFFLQVAGGVDSSGVRSPHGDSPSDLDSILDPLHSDDEMRYISIGVSIALRLLVVVHTDRGDKIRIISARKANAKEARYHVDNRR